MQNESNPHRGKHEERQAGKDKGTRGDKMSERTPQPTQAQHDMSGKVENNERHGRKRPGERYNPSNKGKQEGTWET